MNGAHDLGGMHGFGPVVLEPDEPVFHAEWERRTFALTLAMGGWRRWNLDMARSAREQMPPAEYLATRYYEHWLWGLERLLEHHGFLARRRPGPADARGPRSQGVAPHGAAAGRPPARRRPAAPPERPRGATRRPGAARVQGRRRGQGPEREPGRPHAHPSLRARATRRRSTATTASSSSPTPTRRGSGRKPQHVYSVRFAARELWGPDAHAGDSHLRGPLGRLPRTRSDPPR